MRKYPTQEYLKECFDYVDGKLYWKERPRKHFNTERGWKIFNKVYRGNDAGYDRPHINTGDYYRYINISGIHYKRSRLNYIYHYGEISEGLEIDHLSGINLDDRIENLRAVTCEVNCYNRRKKSNNTSGVTGVQWNSTNKRWQSFGKIDGKQKTLYYGPDFFEAVCARKSFEVNHKYITSRHGN